MAEVAKHQLRTLEFVQWMSEEDVLRFDVKMAKSLRYPADYLICPRGGTLDGRMVYKSQRFADLDYALQQIQTRCVRLALLETLKLLEQISA